MMTLTYDRVWAEQQLTGRCKDRRKIANNTYLERRGDDIAVRLHDTDVVTYKANGDVVLDSGGWRTYTTKERMSTYGPFKWVSQDKGVWYVCTWDGESYRYDDGITLHADGTVTGFVPDQKARNDDKRAKDVKRRIREFVDSITADEIVTALEDMVGDCLLCRFPDPTCLDDHLRSRYFHGTMVVNAIRENHWNPDFVLSMIYHDAKKGKVDKSFFKDPLAKYLRKHLLKDRSTR